MKILKKIVLLFILSVISSYLLHYLLFSLNNVNREDDLNSKIRSNYYNIIANDIKFFPIPMSSSGYPWVSYVDSWGYERTYGGERTHEGTDVMTLENVSGIYPVISVSDGYVENMGWLELGGYRIGIRADNGVYFYYAHLDSYDENIYESKWVKAGELLGFAGDSGYGDEGTKGMFDTHLHFGIYCDYKGKEISFNPYPFLKSIENKVLYYDYGM